METLTLVLNGNSLPIKLSLSLASQYYHIHFLNVGTAKMEMEMKIRIHKKKNNLKIFLFETKREPCIFSVKWMWFESRFHLPSYTVNFPFSLFSYQHNMYMYNVYVYTYTYIYMFYSSAKCFLIFFLHFLYFIYVRSRYRSMIGLIKKKEELSHTSLLCCHRIIRNRCCGRHAIP